MKCGWAAAKPSGRQRARITHKCKLTTQQVGPTVRHSLRVTHLRLQQVVHTALGQVFGLVELLQSLSDLLVRDSALTLLLVIVVQASALQLLQMMLKGTARDSYDGIPICLFLYLVLLDSPECP